MHHLCASLDSVIEVKRGLLIKESMDETGRWYGGRLLVEKGGNPTQRPPPRSSTPHQTLTSPGCLPIPNLSSRCRDANPFPPKPAKPNSKNSAPSSAATSTPPSPPLADPNPMLLLLLLLPPSPPRASNPASTHSRPPTSLARAIWRTHSPSHGLWGGGPRSFPWRY